MIKVSQSQILDLIQDLLDIRANIARDVATIMDLINQMGDIMLTEEDIRAIIAIEINKIKTTAGPGLTSVNNEYKVVVDGTSTQGVASVSSAGLRINLANYVTTTGTAAAATKLATARAFNVSGAIVGTAQNFNGTAAVTIPTTFNVQAAKTILANDTTGVAAPTAVPESILLGSMITARGAAQVRTDIGAGTSSIVVGGSPGNAQAAITSTGTSNFLVAPSVAGGQPGSTPMNNYLQAPAAQTANTQVLLAPNVQGGVPTLKALNLLQNGFIPSGASIGTAPAGYVPIWFIP
jgi:hypothetical protein